MVTRADFTVRLVGSTVERAESTVVRNPECTPGPSADSITAVCHMAFPPVDAQASVAVFMAVAAAFTAAGAGMEAVAGGN
jgi:hypothetical protein